MKSILILPVLALASCQKKESVSYIPEKEAVNMAREAAQDAFTRLSGELATAIAAGGPTAAIPICAEKAQPLVADVASARKIQMLRLTDRPRRTNQRAQGPDLATIESFRASIQNGTPPNPAVENLPNGSSVVRLPILISQPLCLQCHGTGDDISAETRTAIQALYPNDQATGYKMNDLRGIWQITIPPPSTAIHPMNTLALLGAVAIGLALGLTGAGGSILTLPVLVYLAGIPPREAVGLSLLVVGTAAAVGAIQRARKGEVHLKAAGMFVLSGMIGAFLGAKLTHLLSPTALLLTFAALMILVAGRMLLAGNSAPQPLPECKPLRCLLAGGAVGVLTGFLGVGGGFLLMPALAKFARLPLRTATGTSLAIIACNSAAGFLSHLGETQTRWLLAATFSVIAAAGVLAGGKLSSHLPEKTLRQAFAAFVLLTAAFVIWRR
jgi:uncharacterized membrane protein YfcA